MVLKIRAAFDDSSHAAQYAEGRDDCENVNEGEPVEKRPALDRRPEYEP